MRHDGTSRHLAVVAPDPEPPLTHVAMTFRSSLIQYGEPTRELLQGAGHATGIGAANVENLCFAGPDGDEASPVLLVGGAFQTFWSFRNDVDRLRRRWPVILLHLPGQGTNIQASEGLGFDDFAELTRQFLDHHGIERVTPIGLSYGSGIAHRFAVRHPRRIDRLILGGTAPRLQPSLRAVLEAARHLEQRGEHDAWAWSCVFHLLNLEAADHTGIEEDLVERFHASLMRLPQEARDRWWTNSVRLFTEELTGSPGCPALVFGCRHDHFMPPFQAAEVARGCDDTRFGVIDGVDHLAPVERPERVLDVYETFLTGGSLDALPWFRCGEEGYRACEDRRVCTRAEVEGVEMEVEDARGRKARLPVRNIGHHGARVDGQSEAGRAIGDGSPAPLRVRLDGGERTLAVWCPGSDRMRMRFMFTDPVERKAWIGAVDRRMTDAGGGGR